MPEKDVQPSEETVNTNQPSPWPERYKLTWEGKEFPVYERRQSNNGFGPRNIKPKEFLINFEEFVD